MSELYFGGKFLGECDNGRDFVMMLIAQRREGKFPKYLNFSYNEEEDAVYVEGFQGRMRRPLIVVKNGKPLINEEVLEKLEKGEMTWNHLVDLGYIEYLDASEEENCLIGLNEGELTAEHTHMEINPCVMFGFCTNMTPFLNYTQSPKVLIAAKMFKQGLGVYSSNFLERMDTDVSVMQYPQKPIVKTFMYDFVDYEQHPVGQNIIIAIMPYEGFNMDDAIVMNKSSVERGLARSFYYRPYKMEELRYPGGQVDKICVPDKDVAGYRLEESYKNLESDGITFPSAEVNGGDVIIGRVSPPRFLSSLDEFRVGINAKNETSEAVRMNEQGTVESVLLTETQEGNKFVRIKVRDRRYPEIGDKFSSRHGQKGVVGLLVPQEDMPFTASGVIPDVIFNPSGLPSRMTVGHVLEILAAKAGALSGEYIDASPFSKISEEDFRKTLLEFGFREDGLETVYCGKTGRELKAKIFVGNIYYLKLRWMVANKIQARSRGPVQLLTRQPTEGRSKEGGLRLGEMEKDCFIAHGAALTLKERFDSDKVVVPVCKTCGTVAIYNHLRKIGSCPICGEEAPITFVEMSYAFKLLLDELKSFYIYPKLVIKPK